MKDTGLMLGMIESLWVAAGIALAFSATSYATVYYVNDGSTNGDVYVISPGTNTNDGLTQATPKDSIAGVVTAYGLKPGDTVYVDSGVYRANNAFVAFTNAGTAGNPIRIIGSTSLVSRTILDRENKGALALQFFNVGYMEIHNLTITRSLSGFRGLNPVNNCLFRNLVFSNNIDGINFVEAAGTVADRCVFADNDQGYACNINGGQMIFSGCVFFDNNFGGIDVISPARAIVSNSVFLSNAAFKRSLPATSDYNIFWNAPIGGYNHISEYQQAYNTAWRSTVMDPQMANPSAGDFHPRSANGRFDPALTNFVTTDVTTSPMIDFAARSVPVGNEPFPNGSRANIGLYGGTAEASKSRTNAWLLCLSYNDGGQLDVPSGSVYWNYGSIPSNDTVRIDYSGDAGANWEVAATGVTVGAEQYVWSNTNLLSSRKARWRVSLESNTNVVDVNNQNFILRNGFFTYFVNDASTNGDVYAKAPGSTNNLGTSAASPLDSLQALISSETLAAGDVVFVDTGIYSVSNGITIGSGDSGTASNMVQLVGSTNQAAGGTRLQRNGNGEGQNVLRLSGATGIKVSGFIVEGGYDGVSVESCNNIELDRVASRSAANRGFFISASSTISLQRCVSSKALTGVSIGGGLASSGIKMTHSVVWDPGQSAVEALIGSISVSNCILSAIRPGTVVYRTSSGSIQADYNGVYTTPDARIARREQQDQNHDALTSWSIATGQDRHSVFAYPDFADPDNYDFHLKSKVPQGRFKPGVGYVSDPFSSELIDVGNPADTSYTNEPAFNGGRINAGLYGGTPEASKSLVDTALYASSLRDGGHVYGTATLHWVARNFTNGALVSVEYSRNGGANWVVLSNAVSANLELVSWNTLAVSNSPAGLWRVTSLDDPLVKDQTTNFFSIRNAPLTIYVNDGDGSDDVYTLGTGAPTNWLANREAPLDSLATALLRYDLEPGDRVLVDSGSYTSATPASVGPRDSGTAAGGPVSLIGSTGCVRKTSLATSQPGGAILALSRASHVTASNLLTRGGGTALSISQGNQIRLGAIKVSGADVRGLAVSSSSNLTFSGLAVYSNRQGGVQVLTSTDVLIDHAVVLFSGTNSAAAIEVKNGPVQIRNSVLSASGSGSKIFDVDVATRVVSDYNNLWARNSADIGVVNGARKTLMASWQAAASNDLYSLSHDPLFADETAGDFHPRSRTGRRQDGTCNVVTDQVSSLLIDTGNPLSVYTNEPPPNGGRVNIGMFGNTPEASFSRTNAFLVALTFNDGGIVRGTNKLYWAAGGFTNGAKVAIEFSADGGTTWTNVESNINASASSYTWDSTLFPASLLSLWRVVSEANTNIFDASDSPFRLGTGGFTYYVNDASTNGDVYTESAGNINFDGLYPATPLPSIRAVMDKYPVSGGDQILVDTGTYPQNGTLAFGASFSGTESNATRVVGSTNRAAGGSTLVGSASLTAFSLNGIAGFALESLNIEGFKQGVEMNAVSNIALRSLHVEMPQGIPGTASDVNGISVGASVEVQMRACSVAGLTNTSQSAALKIKGNSSKILWDSGVLYSNAVSLSLEGGSLTMSNSVIAAFGPGATAISGNGLKSDYNNYYLVDGARLAVGSETWKTTLSRPVFHENLYQWTHATSNDQHSLTHDPGFWDPGNRDFHLVSTTGRFDLASGSYTSDLSSSVMIDAGPPAFVFTNEPSPNGGRINMGLYGNTVQASKTPDSSHLLAVSFNDGGIASGTNVYLYWLARGPVTGQTVAIEISTNGGAFGSWSAIATGVPASVGSYLWKSTNYASVARAYWRVRGESTAVSDASDQPFTIRNQPFTFFINDAATNTSIDVYCSAPGHPTNSGLSASAPVLSLTNLLARYDLEPGDTIYWDTGIYEPSAPVTFEYPDSGSTSLAIRIRGSTNFLAGGTQLRSNGLAFKSVDGVEVQNIFVNNMAKAIQIDSGGEYTLKNIRIYGVTNGVEVINVKNIRMQRCVVAEAKLNGLSLSLSEGVVWERGVLWSNRTAVSGGGGLSLSNSVLGALEPGSVLFGGGIPGKSDYNSLYLAPGAVIGSAVRAGDAFSTTYDVLGTWSHDYAADQHSLIGDPLMYDPVNRDYHLKSSAGRYDPVAGTNNILDGDTSLLLDAANPLEAVTEPEPNGSRANIGLHGNSGEASLSPTGNLLHAVSLDDGGLVSGTNILFYWLARGPVTGHTLRVEFSGNDGASWEAIITNLAAGTTEYVWNSTNTASTALARWRVVSEVETNLSDQADSSFILRNEPLVYYVNDASTNLDVYCSAPGSPSGNGAFSNSPLNSITQVIDRYDLEPGDTILVDAGQYLVNQSVKLETLDAGIILQGSEDVHQAPSVLVMTNATLPVIDVLSPDVIVRHLTLRGGSSCISAGALSQNLLVEWCVLEDSGTGASMGAGSSASRLSHVVIRDMTGAGASYLTPGHQLEFSVLWSNRGPAILINGGSLNMNHSVVGVFEPDQYAIRLGLGALISSDYNAYNLRSGARMAYRDYLNSLDIKTPYLPFIFENLDRWVADSENDQHSLSGDPFFADVGAGDYHLKSSAGRFVPGAPRTNDAETSLLVDAGAPASGPDLSEPPPNGARWNIGLYGNTLEASYSPTNSRLHAVSLSSGGIARGAAVPLLWNAAGDATGHTVRLEFSSSGGDVWQIIETNIQADAELYFWNSGGYTSTWLGVWRVVSETETNVVDASDINFALRNEALAVYVNDRSTNKDVYAKAPGAFGNDGSDPTRPLLFIKDALENYDFEPGDVLYIDTGTYNVTAPIEVTRFDAWDNGTNTTELTAGGRSLLLQGSTNHLAGGTRIRAVGVDALQISTAFGVHTRDLQLDRFPAGGSRGMVIRSSPFTRHENTRVVNFDTGFDVASSDTTFLRCIARANSGGGLFVSGATTERVGWRHGVLWGNKYGTYLDKAELTIENTILGAFGGGTFCFVRNDKSGGGSTLISDYNCAYASSGGYPGVLLTDSLVGGGSNVVRNLNGWSQLTGQDRHSLAMDPLVANVSALDFHPQSPAGRYVPGSGYLTNVNDGISALIDTGNPASPFDQETEPDGGRVNIGLFGDSGESSLSPTNSRLLMLNLNDGGSVAGDSIPLRWVAVGPVADEEVYLDYSNDGGLTWTNIATNVVASVGQYIWNSIAYGRAAAGLWRITSEQDTNVTWASKRFFSLRNGGSIPFYVNDASTNGDVYCIAPGQASGNGFLPQTPAPSINRLLESLDKEGLDLEPGDIVYIDTGTYATNEAVVIGPFEAGNATNYVVFQGSTNTAAGGTVLSRITDQDSALVLSETAFVELRHLQVRRGASGLRAFKSENCRLAHVTARDNEVVGFHIEGSQAISLENCLSVDNGARGVYCVGFESLAGTLSSSMTINNCTIWDNPESVRIGDRGNAEVYNSILYAEGPENNIYHLISGSTLSRADYNNYVVRNNAGIAVFVPDGDPPQFMPTLFSWQTMRTNDFFTLTHEPGFADEAGGDFHLSSPAGMFFNNGSFLVDANLVLSPSIDAGDPASSFTNEPFPGGTRINLGMYGNTKEASLSSTNPWLLALTLNDGGLASGVINLRWIAGNLATDALVRVEYARDGIDFASPGVLASNLLAYSASGYEWDASGEPLTALGKWRVVLQDEPAVRDENNTPFVMKNFTITLYVNDGSSADDIYCEGNAVGSPSNDGLSPNAPLHDPSVALVKYPLGPGDVIYIDTGSYTLSDPGGMFVGFRNKFIEKGLPGFPISIIGSTNLAAGGSRITGIAGGGTMMTISQSEFVEVSYLDFQGGGGGISALGEELAFSHIRSGNHAGNGFVLNGLGNIVVNRCLAWGNKGWGIVGGSQLAIGNSVVWSNLDGAVSFTSSAIMSNSVIHADVPTQYLLFLGFANNLGGDYNVFWLGSGSRLAFIQSDVLSISDFRALQRETGTQQNSLFLEPLFYDPQAGDFHPVSEGGRYISGFFVKDQESSWTIDAGNPGASFTNESPPNGQRMNVGLYGDTREASRTVTNSADSELLVMTMNDGGYMGSPQEMRWLSRGVSTSELVYLEYSRDGGSSWEVFATNVPAIQQSYTWYAPTSTPIALWRVTSTMNTSLTDTVDQSFVIRLGPIDFFVNDSNTVGDVYTSNPGDSSNNGVFTNSPLDSISAVIDRYDLEPGDRIFVDTGLYRVTNSIQFKAADRGSAEAPIEITGNPDRYAHGGTRFTNDLPGGITEPLFTFENGEGASLSHMLLDGYETGIRFSSWNGSALHDVIIRNGGGVGVSLLSGSAVNMDRCLIVGQGGNGVGIVQGNLGINSCVIWSNQGPAVVNVEGNVSCYNSVLSCSGDEATNVIISIVEGGYNGDYNNYPLQGDARYFSEDGIFFDGLPQWTALTGQEEHSLSTDPGFIDPENHDFHVVSPQGRYDPAVTNFVTTDSVFSLMLDTGSPESPFDQEDPPNGGRRNIGLFGNTIEASKSRTNAWILAITAMAGGRAGDYFNLVWAYGNISTSNTVRLDYSLDAGASWLEIDSAIPITEGQYFWDSRSSSPDTSPVAKWRVVLEANTNLYDETDTTFGLNGPFTFYVNNASTNDDVFTSAIGSTTNLGVFSNAPLDSIKNVLSTWDLEGGDRILVDSGEYNAGSNDVVEISADDAGQPTALVSIIGSTNGVGTVIGPNGGKLFDIMASNIELRDMRFLNGSVLSAGTNTHLSSLHSIGVSFQLNGPFANIRNVTAISNGISVSGGFATLERITLKDGSVSVLGSSNRLEHSLIHGISPTLLSVNGRGNEVINNTLVGSQTAFVQSGDDSFTVLRNNILIADALNEEAYCINVQDSGIVLSDYNNLVARNGAWIGNVNGKWEKLFYWQRESGMDTHSLSHDPLFANESNGDFHVASAFGRYENGGFVEVDLLNSPMVDAGDPTDAYDDEEVYNGFRINIGAYGNTTEASKSPIDKTLTALTVNDGGVLRGTNIIRWLARNVIPGESVRVEYSSDGGSNWVTVVAGVEALDGQYEWNTTPFDSSLFASWRIILEQDETVMDEIDNLFALRNDTRVFYVNDGSQSNDVYTAAVGNNSNDGLTTNTPMRDLDAILDVYDMEPGDLLLVDSGIYSNRNDLVIWSDGGNSDADFVIRGSTNPAIFAGSNLKRGSTSPGNDALEVRASHVRLEHLNIFDSYRGVYAAENTGITVDNVFVYSNVYGITFDQTVSSRVQRTRGWRNVAGNIDVLDSRNIGIENLTLVYNSGFGVRANGLDGDNHIMNSIFYIDALGQSNAVPALDGPSEDVQDPTTFIDYNVYYFSPSTPSGRIYAAFTNLTSWQRDQQKDYRSAITNPLLANVNAGNFHLLSEAGRYAPGTGWVLDAQTSWAIDKGNPEVDYSLEPPTNGSRINIGAFGNTPFASIGSTSPVVHTRVLNDTPSIVTTNDDPYPLIWHALNMPTDLVVRVQYSGDAGTEWVDIATNVSIYQEYAIFELDPLYNSFKGQWRVVGVGGDTTVYATNEGVVKMYFAPVFKIYTLNSGINGQKVIRYPGAWDEDYYIEKAPASSFNPALKSFAWTNILTSQTNLTRGGLTDYIDTESGNLTNLLYRVIWIGTNGLPYQ